MNCHRKTMQLSEEGLLLVVDKPAGWTSFDVVARVRRLTAVRKVGHAGTLDPFATGVLLLLLGKMTRQQDRLMAGEKEYLLFFRQIQNGLGCLPGTNRIEVNQNIIHDNR